ncbi:hypothetical protein C7S16_6670 [Burkholderia thailandensis]|uniref:Uncharacterized protein n=1 Tax=Burkholderia thailandensis TaxID=57975 RepID=A0AAW9CV81_BURTH|nr:hypothetical protein [Burkholderia thailandensis]MDW9252722.1 hypothetical protein [Burkholderia thailandensis]
MGGFVRHRCRKKRRFIGNAAHDLSRRERRAEPNARSPWPLRSVRYGSWL